jgi:hypothetical protein
VGASAAAVVAVEVRLLDGFDGNVTVNVYAEPPRVQVSARLFVPATASTTAPSCASARAAAVRPSAISCWVALPSEGYSTVRSTEKPQPSPVATTRIEYVLEFVAPVTLTVVTCGTAMSADIAASRIAA